MGKIAALLNKRTQGTPRFALEKQALSLARFDRLKTYFPASDFSHDVTPLIEKLQLIKTEPEIQRLLEAGSWADVAFEIGFKAIQAGVAEQEIVAEIEYQLKRQGIRSMSFDTLVLTGKTELVLTGYLAKQKLSPMT